jgi:hypothetical protein
MLEIISEKKLRFVGSSGSSNTAKNPSIKNCLFYYRKVKNTKRHCQQFKKGVAIC